MKNIVELKNSYAYPQDICYTIMKGIAIPSVNIEYKLAYFDLKIPYGCIKLSIIEEDDQAGKICVKMRYNTIASLNMGPLINIVCKKVEQNKTEIQVFAEAKYYNSKFFNFIGDVAYKKIPLGSYFMRRMAPDIYMDKTRVIDSVSLKEKSFNNELGQIILMNVFHKIHNTFFNALLNKPNLLT